MAPFFNQNFPERAEKGDTPVKKKQGVRMDKYLLVSVLAVCVGIFVWWLVTDGLGLFRSNVLPSPVKVCQTFLKKWV